MNKESKLFLRIFRKAESRYGKTDKRLAGEGWQHDWQTLIATIYSAQSRDEMTIPVMENLFKKYPSLDSLSKAPLQGIMDITRRINYYKTKSKNARAAAQMLIDKFNGNVPETIEELVEIPGVGRKTANLVLSEIHSKDTICVDTHVHRLSNVLGLLKTKTPHQTELALQKIAPKEYWSRINRIFVLWGKDVRGRDKNKILAKIK
ncbi:endonuclease III [Candidatus Pacearchaeota archaeon]|nr:endonuclease III [Candidatus Pacearchaeota archaeon]